jgi:phage tail sheath protein FI
MSDQARRLRFRVAILDAPDRLQPADMSAWVTACGIPARNAPFSAIYYPWVASPADTNVPPPVRRLPPSGHVAGVYAQVDNTMGVQHPPANVELRFAVDVVKSLSAAQDGLLNEQGINVIRAFPGYGIRVWGARSLASRDDFQPQWWFIHVRRTLSMIEDSVRKSMRWTVFQPNNDDLRRMLTHSLDVLLQQLWLSGGLKGASPAEAYFVRCDASNNPQSQIDRGWLVCEVGVAVAAPLEFLTFLIRQSPGSAAQVED